MSDAACSPPTKLSRRAVLSGAGALAAAGAVGWGSMPAASAAPGYFRPIEDRRITPRLHYLRFATSATAPFNPAVNVLLPPGYDQSGGRRYPLLYLFHGGRQDFMTWDVVYKIQQWCTAPLIVVMPDAGTGWHCNAYASILGPRDWEFFHMSQLLPFIEGKFRTYAEFSGRAVAGFSMGGFGAMKYAAKYYGHFSSVTCLSGPTDLRGQFGAVAHWANTSGTIDNGLPNGIYGLPWQENRVTMDNPMENIERYRGKRVSLVCGTDPRDAQEVVVRETNRVFSAALNGAGIRHTWYQHGGGHGGILQIDMANEIPKIVAHLRR